jgi:hypothetical protein
MKTIIMCQEIVNSNDYHFYLIPEPDRLLTRDGWSEALRHVRPVGRMDRNATPE